MTRRTWMSAALAAVTLMTVSGAVLAQGPPPGGPGGRGFGFGGPGGPGGIGFLVRMPEVQKELKLEQAQIDLLEALGPGGPGGPGGARPNFQELQNLSPEERQKRFTAMRQQQEKQIAEILDAKQMARLKQLALQQAGVRALDQKEVADALKLTADQRQTVVAAITGERQAMREVFSGFQNNNGEPPSDEQRQQGFQKMQAVRSATDAKLNTVLTEAQKQQFRQMQGAPFTFPQRRFGGPGGPGGPRPGGN